MISIGNSYWLLPAIVIVVAGAILARNAAKHGRAPDRIRRTAGLFKIAGLCLLAACLIEPVWSGVHPKPHSNLFLVLTDNSQSLNRDSGDEARSDAGNLADRFSRTLQEKEDSWLSRLGQDFEVHQFAFDRRLRSVRSVEELKWSGEASALKSVLDGLAARFQERHVGGILLLTDGNATDLHVDEVAAVQEKASSAMPPVFPVVFRQAESPPDVVIDSVSVSETPFEDAPVSLQCDVRLHGLSNETVSESDLLAECQLIDSEGSIVKTERLPVDDPAATLPFRFQFRPIKPGVAFYRLNVTVLELDGEQDKPLVESTLVNNSRIVQVKRGAEKQRILYVGGRPNWEYKFLRRAVEDDDQVDLAGLIRVAKREAKFDFRGRDGQSSNSLFRGFKAETDEETERFDEPVIIRLNMKDAEELRAGFPKDAKELFGFSAIILDDLEAGFFNRDQLTLIEKFVSERGGGLMMLGGAECYQTGDYARTPVADALPVYLDRARFPEPDTMLSLDLTREGWLQPWVRLRSTEHDERSRLTTMPDFKTLNPTFGIKPGASVLATVSDAAGQQWPALVTQSYGRGRSAAMLIGDLWRWQISRIDESPDDLSKAWRQSLRWLVADVAQRVDVDLQPAPDVAPEAVRVNVRVVDEDFLPLENARVTVQVTGPRQLLSDESEKKEEVTVDVTLDAETSLDEAGLYSAVFVPPQAGAWTITADAVTGEGDLLTADRSGWVHQPLVEEFREPEVNRELLDTLASATGGEVVEAEELDDFVASLKSRPMPVEEAWTMPLWDQPLVFLIVLGCLIGEWGLRRTKGLP